MVTPNAWRATGICATTTFVFGSIRTAWSPYVSVTQTAPRPIATVSGRSIPEPTEIRTAIRFVLGSMRNSASSRFATTQTPSASAATVVGVGIAIVASTRPVAALIRRSWFERNDVTQRSSPLTAMAYGSTASGMVVVRRLLAGSIRASACSALFATHTALPSVATAVGLPKSVSVRLPIGIVATTVFDRGSIRETVPEPELATHTASAVAAM